MAHVEIGSLDSALGRMQKNLFETAAGTSQEAVPAFHALGLDVKEIVGLSADQQFVAIAESISHMTDATARAEAAVKIFGRGGIELMNMLREGKIGFEEARKYIDETGQAMSALDIEKLKETDRALKELSESWGALWRSIAIGASPLIAATVQGFREMDPTGQGAQLKEMHEQLAKMREEHGLAQPAAEESGEAHNSIALAMEREAKAAKEAKDAEREAKQIYESTRTPLEKLNDEYRRAVELFGKGKLSGDDLHRVQDKMLAERGREADKADEPFQKIQDEADQLAGSLATPLERAREEFRQAFDLEEMGVLDDDNETVHRAFQKMGEEAAKLKEKLDKPFREWTQEMRQRAEQVHDALKTPMEKLGDKIRDLKELRDGGFLNGGDFQAAMQNARKDYQRSTSDDSHVERRLAANESGSKEDLQGFVDAVRDQQDGAAAQQTAKNTQQIAQNILLLQETTAGLMDDWEIYELAGGGA
jgi:hypothetical protein